jgi:uncharacterized BrkB/YihY/UPF0761 family membrane protein
MKAIFDALNIIYDEEEKRGLVWLNVVSLFCTICAIAGAGLAIALIPARSGGIRRHELPPSDHRISALALDVRADYPGAFPALPLRAEPPAGALALD